MATTHALRPELGHLPPRIARLPVDGRGYPIPWFVQWLTPTHDPTEDETAPNVPEFRIMSQRRWGRAVRERRCWVCGQPLGAWLAFVLGPMCGITRTTPEPPCHRDCAIWSAQQCPFLARPHMTRREDDLIASCEGHSAGLPIRRNPGVALVWVTQKYTVFRDPKGAPLIQVGDPRDTFWFVEGRPATRAEILASVESGLPLLRAADAGDPDAQRAIDDSLARFMAFLPQESVL